MQERETPSDEKSSIANSFFLIQKHKPGHDQKLKLIIIVVQKVLVSFF